MLLSRWVDNEDNIIELKISHAAPHSQINVLLYSKQEWDQYWIYNFEIYSMNRHGWCPFIEKKEFEGEIKTFFCKKKNAIKNTS